MHHIFSLALGLLSWGLTVFAIIKRKGSSFPAMAACSLSLLLQLLELRNLALREDSAAFYDTIGAVVFAAAVLVAVTLVLNLIAARRAER